MYLHTLEDLIDLFITEIIENDQNHNVDRFHFQQDEAFLHHVAAVREFLNNQFLGQ